MFYNKGNIAEQNGKAKNTMFLYAFLMSFVLVALYGVAFYLVGKLFGSSAADTGSFIEVWGPPVAAGTVISLLCCIPIKFMRTKIIIPLAMSFVALYFIIMLIIVFALDDVQYRAMDAYIICFYMLPCIIPGNLISWIAYAKMPVKNRDVEMKL